jgi:hypothetical protein
MKDIFILLIIMVAVVGGLDALAIVANKHKRR